MFSRVPVTMLALVLVLGCDRPPTSPAGATAGADGSAVQAARGAAAAPLDFAVVTFGRNELGTDFFPPGSHDGSFHAKDAIRPRTTVIRAGGTVRFMVSPFHKVAIYQPGIEASDIDVTLTEPAGAPFPFPPLINDPAGRIVRGPLAFGGPPAAFDWTFAQPGKYLVICEVLPHFAGANMYAWVDVK